MSHEIETTRLAYVQVHGTQIPVAPASFELLDGVYTTEGTEAPGSWFSFRHVNGDRYYGPVSSIELLVIDE